MSILNMVLLPLSSMSLGPDPEICGHLTLRNSTHASLPNSEFGLPHLETATKDARRVAQDLARCGELAFLKVRMKANGNCRYNNPTMQYTYCSTRGPLSLFFLSALFDQSQSSRTNALTCGAPVTTPTTVSARCVIEVNRAGVTIRGALRENTGSTSRLGPICTGTAYWWRAPGFVPLRPNRTNWVDPSEPASTLASTTSEGSSG